MNTGWRSWAFNYPWPCQPDTKPLPLCLLETSCSLSVFWLCPGLDSLHASCSWLGQWKGQQGCLVQAWLSVLDNSFWSFESSTNENIRLSVTHFRLLFCLAHCAHYYSTSPWLLTSTRTFLCPTLVLKSFSHRDLLVEFRFPPFQVLCPIPSKINCILLCLASATLYEAKQM